MSFLNHPIRVKYSTSFIQKHHPLKPALVGDAGMDLVNASGCVITVPPGRSQQIACGLNIKIPIGYVGFIKARSSTFSRKGLFVIEGVIDSGYTGPIFTLVWNPGLNNQLNPITIQPFERIAQLIVTPCLSEVTAVHDLPETVRGSAGFGSTGV